MKGLPNDYEVEIAANIDKDGVHPICNDGLPKPIMAHLIRDRIAPVELELAAFENHSKELLVDLVMTDPWTKSRAQAEKLVQDILDLPINSRMKEYYR
jgi:alpha-galactosidase